ARHCHGSKPDRDRVRNRGACLEGKLAVRLLGPQRSPFPSPPGSRSLPPPISQSKPFPSKTPCAIPNPSHGDRGGGEDSDQAIGPRGAQDPGQARPLDHRGGGGEDSGQAPVLGGDGEDPGQVRLPRAVRARLRELRPQHPRLPSPDHVQDPRQA
uniref:Uncharacterized protein n=1 Tax=Aegilops tauschii subsp. strangulata TaxID=200361 RepID=A0A453IMU2_AEGTS